jgi:hypothetical protein
MFLDFNFLFAFSNVAIMPLWLLLIFFPKNPVTRWLAENFVLQMILALIYAFLIITYMGEGEGGFSSLEGIRKGFNHDAILLAGWIHYIVFDSFVGTWMVYDAEKNNIPHIRIVVPLIFTLLLGPVGLLLYLMYKRVLLHNR